MSEVMTRRANYPLHLRDAVGQVLRRHFQSERSGARLNSHVGSTTGAALERAGMRSIRMHDCPTCRGAKFHYERISFGARKRAKVVAMPCVRCDATGQIGRSVGQQKIRETTKICPKCSGCGKLYPTDMVALLMNWVRCYECRGRGYVANLDAAHGPDLSCYFERPEEISGSAVQRLLREMRLTNRAHEAMILELAYGEVGGRVEKKLSAPITLALWPTTAPGKELVRELRCRASTLHTDLLEAWSAGTVRQQTLASQANTAAIVGLEVALSCLFTADRETGFQVRAMAERLDGGLL